MSDFVKVKRIDNQGEYYLSKYQIVAMSDFPKEEVVEIILNTSYFGNDPLNVKGTVADIVAQFDEE